MTVITDTPEWAALRKHFDAIRDLHLRRLFADEPGRAAEMSVEAADLFLDFSKNRATPETLRLLVALAGRAGLRDRIDAMFAGHKINVTEGRAVLHVALRAPRDDRIIVDGQDVVPRVHAVLDRMSAFSDRVRSGDWTGHTGRPIRNVVNIGIGGSDLGPAMAYEALRDYSDRSLAVRFVSDSPSDALVAHLATVYLANSTAIAPVLKALVASKEFLASAGKKTRTPEEDAVPCRTSRGKPPRSRSSRR